MHDSALRFRALHAEPCLLMLPNAWDAASAHVLALAGASAVATSSAAVCWALGYADGGHLPGHELVSAVARMARGLSVPLSVDVEDGLHESPEQAADLIAAVVDAGAVGINVEDGEGVPQELAAKIVALRSRTGLSQLFINARTDVVLRAQVPPAKVVEEVLRRAALYADSGADALFVPGLSDPAAIGEIARRSPLPLNLMHVPGLPVAEELARLGVCRVSAGPVHFIETYTRLLALATDFLGGEHASAAAPRLDYAGMNALFRHG